MSNKAHFLKKNNIYYMSLIQLNPGFSPVLEDVNKLVCLFTVPLLEASGTF